MEILEGGGRRGGQGELIPIERRHDSTMPVWWVARTGFGCKR